MSSNRRFKYEPITIKEPHKEEIKTFNDTEEFTQYYRSHEDEFKNVSTLILNRTYKIPVIELPLQNEVLIKKNYN